MVEVTRMTFLSGSPNMKSRLVRRIRKVSAMIDVYKRQVIEYMKYGNLALYEYK